MSLRPSLFASYASPRSGEPEEYLERRQRHLTGNTHHRHSGNGKKPDGKVKMGMTNRGRALSEMLCVLSSRHDVAVLY